MYPESVRMSTAYEDDPSPAVNVIPSVEFVERGEDDASFGTLSTTSRSTRSCPAPYTKSFQIFGPPRAGSTTYSAAN